MNQVTINLGCEDTQNLPNHEIHPKIAKQQTHRPTFLSVLFKQGTVFQLMIETEAAGLGDLDCPFQACDVGVGSNQQHPSYC